MSEKAHKTPQCRDTTAEFHQTESFVDVSYSRLEILEPSLQSCCISNNTGAWQLHTVNEKHKMEMELEIEKEKCSRIT